MKKILCTILFLAACSNDAQPGVSVSNQSTNNVTNNATNNKSNNSTSTNNKTATNNQTITNNQTGQTTQTIGGCKVLDPAIGVCDILCQTGCEMTEHCVTVATDPVESKCETRGVKGQDVECDMNMDCGVGFGCRNFRGDQACRQYCDPSGKNDPLCQEDYACIPINSEPRAGICVKVTHSCEILSDNCPDGEECYDFQSGRRCAVAGDKTLGEECTTSIACIEGLRCVAVGGEIECRTLCDPEAAGQAGCQGDTTCRALNAQSGDSLPWGACF